VEEFFFIFNQVKFCEVMFSEKLDTAAAAFTRRCVDALFQETSRCRKTPFIDIWPDLVKPFFGAEINLTLAISLCVWSFRK
jgi:hypothetical protein